MKRVKINAPFRFAILSIISYAFFGISACSKDQNADPLPPDCKITAVNLLQGGSTPETASFSYDEDGRIKFIFAAGEAMEFFYEVNGFRQTSDKGDGWSSRSFIGLNAAGLPITKKDTLFNGLSINQITHYTFEYNSQGQLMKISSDDPLLSEQLFAWGNGNLVKYQLGNTIYTLDYYTDRPNQDFCFIDFTLFVSWGINPAKSKNLLKSLSSNGNQLVFDYRFDDHGHIKDWEATVPGQTSPALSGTQSIECN